MIESNEVLRSYLDLTDSQAQDIERVGEVYPWRITEYYASLMDKSDESCPIRMQSVPDALELDESFGSPDPLLEEENTPVPSVIRVYPDRIAVIVTERCPVYCRHCLRKRFRRRVSCDLAGARLDKVVSYIAGDPSIRDVLLTGGDPLMLDPADLDVILKRIGAIEHVELLRIGTRVPCTAPDRITASLADMLGRHHPLWVSTQFNHARELTERSEQALALLIDHGIPVNNQSVLLKGINDSIDVMMDLVRGLVKNRVRPYYLYQAQTLSGTGHFVAPIEHGIDIIRGMRGWTTGFAVPQFVLDTPYGKIPINPEYSRGRNGEWYELESFDGRLWREWNPS